MNANRQFVLTESHIKLIRRLNVRLFGEDWGFENPVIGTDAKRPFGNSDVEYDMAQILRLSVDPVDTYRMKKIFRDELSVAVSVVLSAGSFEPGQYESSDFGLSWRPSLAPVCLTTAIEKALAELEEKGDFNGLPVIEIRRRPESMRREDGIRDGLPKDEIDKWIHDYFCCGVHLDIYGSGFSDPGPYTTVKYNTSQLEKDFVDWILPFIGHDRRLLPSKIDLEGGDMEFQRRC